jgi:YD repeat-containing protein
MKTLILLVLVTWPASPSEAQYNSRTYYGSTGAVVGRSTQSSSGQTTYYGPSGSIIGRTQPLSGGTTVIYDAQGRRVGTVSK